MDERKKKIETALKKARTSIDRILETIEGTSPNCFSVIQQNLAVIGLLKSANLLMLEEHLNSLLKNASLPGKSKRELHALHQELLHVVHTAHTK
ncbi:MAG: metal-sensing transcriptional repressor [Candidatus Moraniibacteriota bacterium]|nr:MAG: metal-sensing transcriptional repressor [Candidatus Moranbacteria bacterium]